MFWGKISDLTLIILQLMDNRISNYPPLVHVTILIKRICILANSGFIPGRLNLNEENISRVHNQSGLSYLTRRLRTSILNRKS